MISGLKYEVYLKGFYSRRVCWRLIDVSCAAMGSVSKVA